MLKSFEKYINSKKRLFNYICPMCNINFQSFTKNRKFCSIKCARINSKNVMKGKELWNKNIGKTKIKVCVGCGKAKN